MHTHRMPVSDQLVRSKVYELLLASGIMPSVADLAKSLGEQIEHVRTSLRNLHTGKALVLMPESGEILMANPWSAVPTSYVVEAGGKSWFGNCVWDGLAIPAAMGVPGKLISSCPCCGEAMTAEVDGRKLLAGDGVVHLALPAKKWWNNIFFS